MSEYTEGTINIDEISSAENFVKPGRYVGKLSAVTPVSDTKSGLPKVDAMFEIQGGEFDGTDIKKSFTMGYWPGRIKDGKQGRAFAPGIAEMKAILATVGKASFELHYKSHTHKDKEIKVANPVEAAKALGTALRGKLLDIAVIEETRTNRETKEIEKNDDGTVKKFYVTKLIGPSTSSNAASDDGGENYL